jgi:phage-related protein
MTEDVSAGRLKLDAYVDTTGVTKGLQTRLNAEMRNVRAKIKAEIDTKGIQAEVKRAAAEATRAARDSRVKLKVELDTRGIVGQARAAAKEISGVKATIKMDLDTVKALAQAEAFRASAGKDVHVNVDVDTAKATAQVEAFRAAAGRDVNVDVKADGDSSGAKDAVDEVTSSLGDMASKAGDTVMQMSKIPMMVGGIYTLASAAVQAASGLFAMASMASSAVSVLAVLPNLAGVAAQGIGSLVLGFSGIFDAVGALGEKEAAATQDATDYADAQRNAGRAVADAQRNIANARHQAADSAKAAAESISDAEWALARAQESAQEAQQGLNDARKQARANIAAMNRELRLGALDERAAMEAVQKAKEDLQDVNWDAASSPQEARDAQMALDQAEADLARIRARRKDQEKETAAANKAGVEGSDIVKAAKDRLRDANHNEQESEENLAQARHDAADSARASAEAIRSATVALADAQREAARAADEQSTALNNVETAFDKLSPAGKRFARYLYSLKPEWDKFKWAVQESLLPPIQRGIQKALPWLKVLRDGMVKSAHVVGRAFENLGEILGQKSFKRDTESIMDTNNVALKRFSRAGLNIIKILSDLAVVAGPTLLKPFSKWVWTLTRGWRESVQVARKGGKLKEFFISARKKAKQLADIVGNLVGALFGLGKGSQHAGNNLLKAFQKTTQGWSDWANSDPGQKRIKKFFKAVKPVTKEVGKLVANLGEFIAKASEGGGGTPVLGFLKVLNALMDGINEAMSEPGVAKFVGWLMSAMGAAGALGFIIGGLLKVVAPLMKVFSVLGVIWSGLVGVIDGLVVAWQMLSFAFAVSPIGVVIVALLAMAAIFVLLYKKVDWFRNAVNKALGWIGDYFKAVWESAKHLWDVLFGHSVFPDLVKGFQWFSDMAKKIFGYVKKAIKLLGKVFVWLWDHVAKPVFKFLRKALSFLWNNIYKPILKALWKAIKTVGAVFKWLWEKAVKPAFTGIWKAIQWAWKNVLKPTFKFLWQGVKNIGGWFKWLWDHAVKPAWDNIKRGINVTWKFLRDKVFGPLVDLVKTTIPNAFDAAVKAIKSVWDTLKEIARKPVEFIVNTVYSKGIRPVVNAIPGVPDLPDLHFARGGVLPGYTPGKDVHQFSSPTAGNLALSGGEGIAVPQVVRAIGKRGWDYLNEAGRRGVGAARDALANLVAPGHAFAKGGIVMVDGEPMTRLAAAQLLVANNVSGLGMRVMQGSYQPPTSYSGTSHTGGGVMDTTGGWKEQSILRKVAFAAWARNVAGYPQTTAGSGAHVHSVSRIDPTSAGHAQLASFARGENGIGGPDYGPNPSPVKALVDEAIKLSGVLPASVSGGSDGDGGWWGKFKAAIGAVKDFATSLPGWFDKIGDFKGWGDMFVDSLKSTLGKARGWINDKIPLPGPFPNIFDQGGAWPTGTMGANFSGKTETVMTNSDMVSISASLAELSRNLNKMTTVAHPGVTSPAAMIENLTLHAEPNKVPEVLGKVNHELRKINLGGVHARRAP